MKYFLVLILILASPNVFAAKKKALKCFKDSLSSCESDQSITEMQSGATTPNCATDSKSCYVKTANNTELWRDTAATSERVQQNSGDSAKSE